MSQPLPFLFAALPSSTSTNLHPSTMVQGARKLSVGSVHSSASSVYSVGSIGSVGSINGSGDGGSNHSFYNLSKSCNNSSIDLNHFVHTAFPPPPAFPPASTLVSRTSTPPTWPPSPPPVSTHPAFLPHRPVIVGSLYCNSNLSQSNLSLSRHNTCGHSLYSLGSNANSSSYSLASSQLSQFSQFSSGDKVQHAFGSMPSTGVPLPPSLLSSSSSFPNIAHSTSSPTFSSPSHPFSASSSSLPLAASVNTPITTPATNTTKALSSASSLTSRHRSHPQPQSSQQKQQQNKNINKHTSIGIKKDNNINNTYPVSSSSSSDLLCSPLTRSSSSPSSTSTISATANPSTDLPQYQLRPLLLPPVATLGLLPPGTKKFQNTTITTTTAPVPPPLNTKSLPRLPQKPSSVSVNSLSPAFVSGPSPSHSYYSNNTMMTSTSPRSAGSFSPAVSSPTSSAPSPNNSRSTTSHRQQSFVSLAITELVITEAQYLATIQRVAHALNQTMENIVSAGRKESATIRTLVDRWSDLMRIHAKFHDDIVAVNEDLRETASLINCMLVTLEPILVDHGRDLSNALKKLIRRDQNSEHTFAEWDSALRQPFDHLAVYDDWMQRIDPQDHLSRDYRAHMNGLIYKIKMVTDANQHPRNMLRRLSTIAKTVINKRRSSLQLLNLPSTPETPTMDVSNYRQSQDERIVDTPSTTAASTPVDKDGQTTFLPSPKTIQDLDIAKQQRQLTEEPEPQDHHETQQQEQQDTQEPEEQEQDKDLETVMEPVLDKAPILCPMTPLSPTFISTDVYLETTVTDFHADSKHRPKAAGDRTSTYLSPIQTQPPQQPTHQLPHRSSAASDLSSAGTLAVSPTSPCPSPCPSTSSGMMQLPLGNDEGVASSVSSSSCSIRSKTSSTAETVIAVRQQTSASTLNSESSLIRQKFLAEKEARKATLRVGTCEVIQARAESLQSPTTSVHSAGLGGATMYTPSGKGGYGAYYQARADATKVSPTRPVGDKASKPPVKSLISFWEQVSDPMEL